MRRTSRDWDGIEMSGECLAKFPRFANGVQEQIRWTLEQFGEGTRPFVRMAIWQKSGQGAWYPIKGRQLTLRANELGEALAALGRADDAINGDGDEHDEPEPPPRSRGRREASKPTPPAPVDPTFNEFDEG